MCNSLLPLLNRNRHCGSGAVVRDPIQQGEVCKSRVGSVGSVGSLDRLNPTPTPHHTFIQGRASLNMTSLVLTSITLFSGASCHACTPLLLLPLTSLSDLSTISTSPRRHDLVLLVDYCIVIMGKRSMAIMHSVANKETWCEAIECDHVACPAEFLRCTRWARSVTLTQYSQCSEDR